MSDLEDRQQKLQSELTDVNRLLRDGATNHRRVPPRRFRLKSIRPGRSWSGGSLPTEFNFEDLRDLDRFVTIPFAFPGWLDVTDDIIEEARVQAEAISAKIWSSDD